MVPTTLSMAPRTSSLLSTDLTQPLLLLFQPPVPSFSPFTVPGTMLCCCLLYRQVM